MAEGLHRFYGGRDLHFLTFSREFSGIRLRYRLVVVGYVVMPEHVHLLVSEPQRKTLSTAIQALKLGVVRSLRCADGSAVVTPPRSRKTGETWGTPLPDRFWQAR